MPTTVIHPANRPPLTDERLAQLRQLLPEAFRDGQLDWKTLREILGSYLPEEGSEHYGLSWPGKREARRLAHQPSSATLEPVPGEGVNEETTENVFIEGENLEVLKVLQKAYAGRVKMIYIDPPYNTGNDFIYSDNFTEPLEAYLRRTGQADEEGLLTSNPVTSGRFHSNWLSMIYPRLVLARSLLSEDGVIFVSIDDSELHNLRAVMNEIFGEEQFIGSFVWQSRHNVDSRNKSGLSSDHEYVLIYGSSLQGRAVNQDKYSNPDNDPRGPWMSDNLVGLATKEKRPNLHYDLIDPQTGINYGCPTKGWRYSPDTMAKKIEEGRILWPSSPEGRPRHKKFYEDLQSTFTNVSSLPVMPNTLAGTRQVRALFHADVFDFPKPVELPSFLIEQATDEQDLVLDFFAGSCPTAEAVYRLAAKDGINRRFVMVQLPEVTEEGSEAQSNGFQTIAEVGKERIRRASTKVQKALDERLDLDDTHEYLDLGFKVFRLARSNYRPWEAYTGEDIQQLQSLFDELETPLVEEWSEEDLLTEVMLLEGFPLHSSTTPQPAFTENQVRLVESDFHEHRLWVCLDERVAGSTVAQLGDHMGPNDVFICLDSALTDQSKLRLDDTTNLHVIGELRDG